MLFIITGGGSMHLNNSFAENKNLNVFLFFIMNKRLNCGFEGYFRVKNNPAILNVTSGPGGINALNGVFRDLYFRFSESNDNQFLDK